MERIRNTMESAGITVTEKQLVRLDTYYQMVVERNRVMNLTSITERNEFIEKHLLDSLAPLTVVPELQDLFLREGTRMIDVGTGAGFPGIPLKILCPSLTVTLLDSLQKRVGFLQEVIDRLELSGIEAVHLRAEEGGQNPAYREKYDLAVSRAVAHLSVLTEYDLPFVRVGGTLLAYKTASAEEELPEAEHAIRELGGMADSLISLTLPSTDIRRCFVPIRKVRSTPKKYPRKAGTAKKNPQNPFESARH